MKTLFTIVLLAVSINVSFAQWGELSSGITSVLYTVSAPTNTVCWAAGAGGVVRRTIDGGTTWTGVGGGAIGTAAVYNIFAVNDMTALCTTSPGATFVYLTVNGGVLWTQVFTQPGGFIDGIWMSDATNGFMVGDAVSNRWSLWRTVNGGVTWDSTGMYLNGTGGEAGWNNSLYKSGSNIYFGTGSSKVYYSSNNGSNWVAQPTTGLINSVYVWLNGARGFCGSDAGGYQGTVNSGTTWTAQTVAGTGSISGIAVQGTNWWYCRGLAIYNSVDNGVTYTLQYTAPAGAYSQIIRARDNTNIWGVRANGGISKFTGPTLIEPVGGNVPDRFSLSQNYPNPFNPETKINFSIPTSSNVTIKVFDVRGREVKTLVNESVNAGTYKISVDASAFASGIYFYTIKAGFFTDTKKMMLVK